MQKFSLLYDSVLTVQVHFRKKLLNKISKTKKDVFIIKPCRLIRNNHLRRRVAWPIAVATSINSVIFMIWLRKVFHLERSVSIKKVSKILVVDVVDECAL